VEFVSVTVDVPTREHALVADVPVMATGLAVTVTSTVLLELRLVEPQVLAIAVTVMVDVPAVVSPVAVNVPVPAVETVRVADNPVCEGVEVL